MSRSSIIIPYFLLFVLAITSCCDSEFIREIHFSDDVININPYTGEEVLRFKSLSGDSMVLAGEYRKREFYNFYPEKKEGGDNCPGSFVNLEDNVTRLTSTSNVWRFDISLSFYYYLSKDSAAQYINFSAHNHPDSTERSESARGAFFDTDTIYNKGMYLTHQYDYHHSLPIGPVTFNDVYEFFLMKQMYSPGDWVDTLYYSISLGIVGFKTRLGEIWYMENHSR